MALPRMMPALLLLAGAMVLAAGCFGDVIVEQDIVLCKLTKDGNTEWMKTIDSGNDDMVAGLLLTLEGEYLLAGGRSEARCNQWSHQPAIPVLTWVSGSGDVLKERVPVGKPGWLYRDQPLT
ncbi:MAG: hypothetical protein GYA23_11775 [Methanomicrobiales archaeon]|nr:hypothetical protein [Methanomicrobiales archaeon]